MSLLWIVPTRGRPYQAGNVYRSWLDTLAIGYETDIIFAVDSDDPRLREYETYIPESRMIVLDREVHGYGMVAKLNTVARFYCGQYSILGFGGDDHLFRTYGWHLRFKEELSPRGSDSYVVYGNDLYQGQNCPTAVAMRSEVVKRLGYFAPETLFHLYCDNAWKDIGERLGLAYLDDVIIEHMHPAVGKAEWDPQYKFVNSVDTYRDDKAFYDLWREQELPTVRERVMG